MILWIHDDCLGPESRVFAAYREAPAVYVFDEAWIERRQWALKRIGFVYECLLELQVEILSGDVATPDPHLQEQILRIGRQTPVDTLHAEPLVDLPGDVDLRRFSRYWKRAEAALFPRDEM